jgi:segregation and condensation protein A
MSAVADPPAAALPADGPLDGTAWEDPPRRRVSGDAPVLAVEGFQGPLDWLLDMAAARKIDLTKLSIAALIEAFAIAMQTALARPDSAKIEHWAAWIVMAATLTELRSKLLLPPDSPEATAARAQAEALQRALVARAELRIVADWLERRPQLGREVFPRGAPEAQSGRRFGDLTDLLRACLVALRVPQGEESPSRLMRPRFWTVAEAIGRIRDVLGEHPDGAAFRILLPPVAGGPARDLRCKAAVASTLLAGLELARAQDASIDQTEDFGAITLRVVVAAKP